MGGERIKCHQGRRGVFLAWPMGGSKALSARQLLAGRAVNENARISSTDLSTMLHSSTTAETTRPAPPTSQFRAVNNLPYKAKVTRDQLKPSAAQQSAPPAMS